MRNVFLDLIRGRFSSLVMMFMHLGVGMEVISGAATAPGAVFTAWTVAAGNSLTIRSAPLDSKIYMINAWGFNQVTGAMRIRSPRLHDFQQAMRFRIAATNSDARYPNTGDDGFNQPLTSQDTLTVEQTGSAVAGQIEGGSLLVYYTNLPSINARLIGNDVLTKAGQNVLIQEVSITTGITIGYSGQVLITSLFDVFKANTDYALLGAMVDTRVATIRVQGIDTGNLGVGIPGEPTQAHVYSTWFQRLSIASGLPCIPVFNSANKGAILIDAFGNQAAITTVVSLILVELAPGIVPAAKANP